jgi:chemotaxis protein MotB
MHRSDTRSESTATLHPDDNWMGGDPWDETESGQSIDTDGWLLSYADMLTLMLTLLVMLLAFNQIQNKHPEPAQVKIAHEISPDATPAEEAQPGHSGSESVPLRPRIPAALTDRTGPEVAGVPPDRNNIADRIPASVWFPNAAEDDRIEADFRRQFVSEGLKQLELSIDPVDALDHYDPTSPAIRTFGQFDKPSARVVEEQAARDTALANQVEHFQRLISERKLDKLIDVAKVPNALHMEVNERILFETGEAELKPNGKALLDELANLLQNQPGNLHIEGHTDNVPIATARFPSNWELSASRASSVARYLIGRSVNPDRFRAIGFADTKPRADNQTPEGRSKNRRVSLIIEMNDSKPQEIR